MKKLILCLFLTLPSLGMAEEIYWNAVITQGIFHTDDNNFYGKSEDDLSFDFTEASLSASRHLFWNTSLSAQAIYRHAGAGFDAAGLDYFMLDTQMIHLDYLWGGFRLGRIKVPYGLYNDARDVVFTRPSIYLSQGLYYDNTLRELLISYDGLGFYLDYFSQVGQFNLEFGYGLVKDDNLGNFSNLQMFQESGLDPTFEINNAGAYRFTYKTLNENFIASISGIFTDKFELHSGFAPNSLPPLLLLVAPDVKFGMDLGLTWDVLTLQYSTENWTFTSEYGRINFTLENAKITIFGETITFISPELLAELGPGEDSFNTEAYYFQIERRLNEKWSVFARHDIYYFNEDDPNGDLYAGTSSRVNYTQFAKDTGIGLKWAPTPKFLTQAEFHYIDGTAFISPEEMPNLGETVRYWTLAAMSFSYRF